MLAHGAPRLGGVLIGNAGDDARMLVLDALEISPPLGRRVNRKPHALARNDQAAEEGKEARELRVAGSFGDGAMEGEVLRHRALAAMERPVDATPRRADGADLAAIGALGSERRRLDLDREAQLHHLQDVVPAFSLALPNLFLGKF